MLVHSNKVDLSYEWHIFPNLKLIIRFPGKTNYKVPRDNLSIPKFLKNNLCLHTWIRLISQGNELVPLQPSSNLILCKLD